MRELDYPLFDEIWQLRNRAMKLNDTNRAYPLLSFKWAVSSSLIQFVPEGLYGYIPVAETECVPSLDGRFQPNSGSFLMMKPRDRESYRDTKIFVTTHGYHEEITAHLLPRTSQVDFINVNENRAATVLEARDFHATIREIVGSIVKY